MKLISRSFFLIAFLLSACAPGGTPAATPAARKTPQPASTPTETASGIQVQVEALRGLIVKVADPWFGTDASLFESQVADFNATNAWGIQVVAVNNGNYSLLYENVTAALPTAERPDLVIALPEHARLWDADGAVADLTPYVTDPVQGWSADEVSDFAPVFWNQDVDGARRLALPYQRTARFMLWNQTWAGQLGFDSPPASPEDFRQQACRAHQSMLTDALPANDGLGGWLVDTDAMTALAWMQAFGGGALEGADYRFMTPQNMDAFSFVRKMQEDGCAWMPASNVDPIASFVNHNALFITVGLEQFPEVARAFSAAGSADQWIPLAFPGLAASALPIYGSSLVMLKSNDPQQLATWLFMDWLLSTDNDARSALTTGFFPLRTSTLNLLTDYEASHPQWGLAVKLIPQGSLQPQLASWRAVRVMLGDGFTEMFRVSGQAAVILTQMESTSHELNK
jgi:ABC-type glycerol-3-phosphate transport system substrate-binding protein